MARYGSLNLLNSDQTKTEVHSGHDFVRLLTKSISTIQQFQTAWSSGDIIGTKGIHTTFESCLANSVTETSDGRVFIDMFRETLDIADRCGGVDPQLVSQVFTSIMTQLLKELASGQSHTVLLHRLITDINASRKHLHQINKRVSNDEYKELLKRVPRKHVELVDTALQLCGAEGRLTFQSAVSNKNTSLISVQDDYVFDLVVPCLGTMNNNIVEFDEPRVLIVDGFIGSVSEIDHILSEATIQKQPLVIFARKFDPDVLSTIGHNNNRGTFKILPVIVPYDADSANVLKDLAAVCNTSVISSLLGQLVTSTTFESLTKIDGLKAETHALYIRNESQKENINEYIRILEEQLSRSDNEISHGFISRRIRCLSNRLIHINIDDVDGRRVVEVDRGLRVINLALKRGCVKRQYIETIKSNILQIVLKNIHQQIFAIDELDQLLVSVGGLIRLLGMSGCLLRML